MSHRASSWRAVTLCACSHLLLRVERSWYRVSLLTSLPPATMSSLAIPSKHPVETELLSLAKIKAKNSTVCELPDNRQQSFFPVLDNTDSIGRSWLLVASLIPFSEVESEPSRRTVKSKAAVMGDCLFKTYFACSLNNGPPLPLPTHRQWHSRQQQR